MNVNRILAEELVREKIGMERLMKASFDLKELTCNLAELIYGMVHVCQRLELLREEYGKEVYSEILKEIGLEEHFVKAVLFQYERLHLDSTLKKKLLLQLARKTMEVLDAGHY